MKMKFLITALLLSALAGCTQLSAEDRALVTSANDSAKAAAVASEAAKTHSIQAVEEARQARAVAEAAANDAKAARAAAEKASARADRIFRQGQNK